MIFPSLPCNEHLEGEVFDNDDVSNDKSLWQFFICSSIEQVHLLTIPFSEKVVKRSVQVWPCVSKMESAKKPIKLNLGTSQYLMHSLTC